MSRPMQESGMKHYTVMVFKDRTSPVKRYLVPRWIIKRGVWALIGVVAVVSLITWDYVRVRQDSAELASLREETESQRIQIDRFEAQMRALDDRFEKIREFERKVRVIANLPGAATGTLEEVEPGLGGGGGEEASTPSQPEGDAEAPQASDVSAGPQARIPSVEDPAWFARLTRKADRMDALARTQEASLADLVEDLRGKSNRLASTPSIWPTKGWVTSGFGRRISPFTGKPQFHAGIDIAAEPGTEIVAPARGKVIFVGRKGPLGKTVIVDHGFGVRSTYGHVAAFHVKKGQVVERGEWIASVGNTGRSTGPHLHYAMTVNGKSVDPSHYILE